MTNVVIAAYIFLAASVLCAGGFLVLSNTALLAAAVLCNAAATGLFQIKVKQSTYNL